MKTLKRNSFKFIYLFSVLIAGFFILQSCVKAETSDEETAVATNVEGEVRMIPIQTPVGEFNVWTKRFGTNPNIKVLSLHGGPAMTHEYFEALEPFFMEEGFEYYHYDQLGSYHSDQPTDMSLWTLERFIDEVDQVRQAIGGDESNFYIIGNSWGGLLGMEYALKHQDKMKGLIVSNMMADIKEYNAYAAKLSAELPEEVLAEIISYEEAEDYTNPRYMDLLMEHYYPKHVCRLEEWPDAVLRAFDHGNDVIYTLMQGPSERGIIGDAVLADWSIKSRLGGISVPTLMVGGEYDTMDPKAMEEQSKLVQNGRYLHCPNGSHLPMWDDQEIFMDGVIKFIRDVDEGNY